MPLTTPGAAAPAKETTKKTAKIAKAQASAAMVAEAAVKVDESLFGRDSDKIAFVAAIGDPSRPDVTPITTKDGKQDKRTDPTIVGYAFKLLEDMDVPDCGIPDDLIKNPMDGKELTYKQGKKGDVVYLTRLETGALLSQTRFAGKATGGAMHVTCSYAAPKGARKAGDGSVAAATKSDLPSVSLKSISGGSIKDIEMIKVLTSTPKKVGARTVNKKTLNPDPKCAKFESLCRQNIRAAGAGKGASKAASARNEKAEGFMAILGKKFGNVVNK